MVIILFLFYLLLGKGILCRKLELFKDNNYNNNNNFSDFIYYMVKECNRSFS